MASLDRHQLKWDRMRRQFGKEKWFISALKREHNKNQEQRRLDRELFDAVCKNNRRKALNLLRRNSFQNQKPE